MKTLIIYDTEGFIVQQITGTYRIPVGIPYLESEIPSGKIATSVNVSTTTHTLVLEDVPQSQVESLEQQIADLQYQLMVNGVL